jgi:signal transduction histidine kinase
MDLKIVWANKIAGQITASSINELIGKHCYEICGMPKKYCEGCPVTLVQKSKLKQEGEICINNKSNIVTAIPVKDDNNKNIGIVQVIRDITERKNLEHEVLKIGGLERRRIGHELHDGLGQIFTGIAYTSKLIEKRISEGKQIDIGSVRLISENISKSKLLVKNIIQGLCPVEDDPEGLFIALDSMIKNIEKIYNIKCHLDFDKSLKVPDNAISSHIFLICQEAVNNAIKHSGCTQIKIYFEKKSNIFVFGIEDDGKGFDYDTCENKGMGLKTIKYRVSVISASVELNSSINNGTKIRVIKIFNCTDGKVNERLA